MLCLREDIEELLGKYPDPREGEAGAVAFRLDREAGAALPCFAVVADNRDPLGLGRIRAACEAMGPGTVTDWIPVARPCRGASGSGAWFVPEAGTQVLLVFLGQDPGAPVAVGFVFDRLHRPPEPVTRKAGDCVVWQTRSHRVEIREEEGKEALVVSTKEGKLRYEATRAGGLRIVNELGDIEISCGNLRVAAGAGLGFAAEEGFSLKGGGDVSLAGAKTVVFEGGGELAVRGKNIRLNGSRGVCACGKQMAKGGDKVMGFDVHNTELPSASGTTTVPLPHPFIGKLVGGLSANVKIGGAGAAVKGSVCKHDDGKHCLLPGAVKFTQNPKMEGTVTGGTAAGVKINGKEAAVAGSTVSTCSDTGQRDNSVVMAAGASLPMPAIINPANTEAYNLQREQREARNPELSSARWHAPSVGEGGELRMGVQVRDIGEGNALTFQVWKDGQDPASHIPLAQIPAVVRGAGAEAAWSWRWEGEGPPPDEDPKFFFTVHSAWCAFARSGTAAVRLRRPQLSNPQWLDRDGKAADRGLAGEALRLGAGCNADMEEGAGVVFRVYPEGADAQRDRPVAELAAANAGGTAEARWVYRYVHDAEQPLREKPRFFFVAAAARCREARSGAVEISQNLEIAIVGAKEYPAAGTGYRVFLPDGSVLEGKTGENGIVRAEGLVPGIYEIMVTGEENGNDG
ncbi:MAG: phage baseplate assembly protein V [Spirochaetia bacterium]|jgi:uncharacterized Zn-binding protein involved in type VI secretion|nr:phage baseplate assembly protein V [Spirochaetia bacterium]